MIYCLSDTHYGNKYLNETSLLELVYNIIEPNCSHLIITGDLWDFLKVGFSKSLFLSRIFLDKIIELNIPVDLVIGNHEEEFSCFEGLSLNSIRIHNELDIQLFDKKFRFFHGHQYDHNWLAHKKLVKCLLRTQNFLDKNIKGFPKLYKKVLSDYSGSKDYEKTVKSMLITISNTNPNIDVVIIGHTHYPTYFVNIFPKFPTVFVVPDYLYNEGYMTLSDNCVKAYKYLGGKSSILLYEVPLS